MGRQGILRKVFNLTPSSIQHRRGRQPVFNSKASVDFEVDVADAWLRKIVAVIIFLQVCKHQP
jgi:hypothetical protein